MNPADARLKERIRSAINGAAILRALVILVLLSALFWLKNDRDAVGKYAFYIILLVVFALTGELCLIGLISFATNSKTPIKFSSKCTSSMDELFISRVFDLLVITFYTNVKGTVILRVLDRDRCVKSVIRTYNPSRAWDIVGATKFIFIPGNLWDKAALEVSLVEDEIR